MAKRSRGVKTVRAIILGAIASVGLVACDENGEFAFPTPGSGAQSQDNAPLPANAPNQRVVTEQDVERPDIFELTDRALWDGRPSLGGVWVAHPDVTTPERVLIRSTDTGETIIGALFRRERQNPGPAIQISSDAAEELGVLAGAPTELYVVALRREEVETVAENPVIADLAAPVSVASAPLDDAPAAEADTVGADTVGADNTAAETDNSAATTAAAGLAAIAATAEAGADTAADSTQTAPADTAPSDTDQAGAVDVSGVFDTPTSAVGGQLAQIGVFSNEVNANDAAARIRAAGIAAEVQSETMGGQTVWRLVAGPLSDAAALTTLRELGFVDAFIPQDTPPETE